MQGVREYPVLPRRARSPPTILHCKTVTLYTPPKAPAPTTFLTYRRQVSCSAQRATRSLKILCPMSRRRSRCCASAVPSRCLCSLLTPAQSQGGHSRAKLLKFHDGAADPGQSGASPSILRCKTVTLCTNICTGSLAAGDTPIAFYDYVHGWCCLLQVSHPHPHFPSASFPRFS